MFCDDCVGHIWVRLSGRCKFCVQEAPEGHEAPEGQMHISVLNQRCDRNCRFNCTHVYLSSWQTGASKTGVAAAVSLYEGNFQVSVFSK